MYAVWNKPFWRPTYNVTTSMWRKLNPTWQIKMWNADECDALAEEYLPESNMQLYKRLKPVMKADLTRYMIMHKHGGFYSDLDCVPYKKVEDILALSSYDPSLHQAAVFKQFQMAEEEVQEWLACFFAQVDPIRARLGNSPLYASKPNAELFLRMMKLALGRMGWLYEREAMWADGDKQVANFCPEHLYPWAAGPDVATETVFRIDGKVSPIPVEGVIVVNAVKNNDLLHDYGSGVWKVSHQGASATKKRDAEGWCSIAAGFRRWKMHSEALAHLETAIGLAPEHRRSWLERGNNLAALTRLEEALIAYGQAVALDPTWSIAYLNRGITALNLAMQKQSQEIWEGAVADMKKAISIDPVDGDPYLYLGIMYQSAGRAEEAVAHLQSASKVNPASAVVAARLKSALGGED
jgi:tetratricopeptide (TPR) repeat protein